LNYQNKLRKQKNRKNPCNNLMKKSKPKLGHLHWPKQNSKNE